MNKIWNIIWDNDLFHWATAILFLGALTVEIILFIIYVFEYHENREAIKALKLGDIKNNKKTKQWINYYLETDEKNKPIQNNKGQYLLTSYPEILSYSTRSNLHFVGTLCTAIGVLGTFYGIQSGIGNIPLNNLSDSQSLLAGVTGLLEGMKTAFSTSLMGLGSGSLFTIILFVTDSFRQNFQNDLKRSLNKIIVTGKDSSQDTINSLKEIADSFKQFDFSANLRASQALERVAQNFNPKIIGQEVGNVISSQLNYTIESQLTPAFNNIHNSQQQLIQISTQEKDILENLIININNNFGQSIIEINKINETTNKLGNNLTQEINNTIETQLTPVFNNIYNSQQQLAQISTQQKGTLENLLGNINHNFGQSIIEIQKLNETTNQLGNNLTQEINNTIETKLTPVFNNIHNSQQQLAQISAQQKDTLENLLRNINRNFGQSIIEIQKIHETTNQLGNNLTQEINNTIETKLTPVFNNIHNSQQQLAQISAQQKDTLQNLISNMRNELITPVVERLDQSAKLTKEASQAVTKLNNELGGISKELAMSVTTIQQFQKETLGELKDFANSLKLTLTDFQHETRGVLEKTAISINNAVNESIKGMEAQRQAFEESANIASSVFRGIKEDLEQSLQTQTESQKQMLVKIYSAISSILTQADESFKTQSQTLETVGNKASELMNNAKDNLEKTLLNIDVSLQKTRQTVQYELENFREQYQESLNQFFTQQNELLEGTLGKQRDALLEVVENLRKTFEYEIDQRNSLMQDLTNTITQVKEGINEINQVSIELQERVKDIQQLTGAMGLNSAKRLTQLQELARNIGTATQDFNNLLYNWQSHLNSYIDTSTQWQTKFFNEADSSMSKICSSLLETANVLVTIEKEKQLNF